MNKLVHLALSAALAIGLTIYAILALSTPANAQQCAPVEIVTSTLADKFHEQRIFTGKAPNGMPVELWVSAEGTWSFLIIQGEMACLIASGDGATMLPAPNV